MVLPTGRGRWPRMKSASSSRTMPTPLPMLVSSLRCPGQEGAAVVACGHIPAASAPTSIKSHPSGRGCHPRGPLPGLVRALPCTVRPWAALSQLCASVSLRLWGAHGATSQAGSASCDWGRGGCGHSPTHLHLSLGQLRLTFSSWWDTRSPYGQWTVHSHGRWRTKV